MLRSESIDLEGVTLIFIESDLETPLAGVLYWVSRVLDLTGVLGGMKTMSWLEAALDACPAALGKISDLAASLSLVILAAMEKGGIRGE